MDREFKKAIEAGERNQKAFELVRNWCAHVRIEKFGTASPKFEFSGIRMRLTDRAGSDRGFTPRHKYARITSYGCQIDLESAAEFPRVAGGGAMV